ncbi:hypothetical protein QR680_009876 [Steinernema hermaphroditum]|uniref:Uncharacterized protein n=1 Tax=Steinernema hermaphroditum TaxID=289476 RepID=A0AA39ILY7_9BILA|nr:hypothetical protein QR680_009876 [Steinernema hermaphroditum]
MNRSRKTDMTAACDYDSSFCITIVYGRWQREINFIPFPSLVMRALFLAVILFMSNLDALAGLKFTGIGDLQATQKMQMIKENCSRMRRYCRSENIQYGPKHTMCLRFKKKCNESEIDFLLYVDGTARQRRVSLRF